jgi:hypothetical protein
MEPDTDHVRVDGMAYVKVNDRSSPAPEFERILTYTLEGDPREFEVRFHRGATPADSSERIRDRHPGKQLDQLWIDGGVYDDADSLMDWVSTTGCFPVSTE